LAPNRHWLGNRARLAARHQVPLDGALLVRTGDVEDELRVSESAHPAREKKFW
jgi:hypothetical protein